MATEPESMNAAGPSAADLAAGTAPTVAGVRPADLVDAEMRGLLRSAPEVGPVIHAPHVEGYQITGRVGEGGMAVVWRAVQLSTKRIVALKVLRAASLGSDRARRRFEREIELTARLDHPNIARIYDGGVKHGVCFYAMDLIPGRPLDRYVRERRPDRRSVVEIMVKVCQAVQHAHQKGVIHRDLKPTNILVTEEGTPHVLDFGLAKAMGGLDGDAHPSPDESPALSIEGEISGTPQFMSPEQARGDANQVDTRCDVYTLGVILFNLLCGRFPHDVSGQSLSVIRRIAEEEPLSIRRIDSSIDRDLAAVIGKALDRDPDRRYQSAGGLAEDLRRCLDGEPVTARSPGVLYRLRKRFRRHRKAILVSGFILLVLCVTCGYVAWDYYQQWGEWSEVANYSFTAAGSGNPEEALEFFNASMGAPRNPWPMHPGGLVAVSSEWCVLKDVHVRGDVRVVVKARFLGQPDGIDLCLHSDTSHGGPYPPGYSAQAAGYGGRLSFLGRNDRSVASMEPQAVAAPVASGSSITMTFEREGENLLLKVNDYPALHETDLLPLTGQALDGVAIRCWARDGLEIQSIVVYRRALPRKANPVVAGDALVEAGDLAAALRQYENLADDYPNSAAGELALAKACRLSAVSGLSDASQRGRLRQRMADSYPRSPLLEPIDEADALADWQDERVEDAMEKLDRIQAAHPGTRLPLVLASSARKRLFVPPPSITQRLMTAIGKVSSVTRLPVGGLGATDLTPLHGMSLQALDCDGNPIESLEPLRGMPLTLLACSGSKVRSLDPLKGMHLETLRLRGTPLRDLEAVRGMPLRDLDCTESAVASLEPLAACRSLTRLDAGHLAVTTLEPLLGLKLGELAINDTAITDLGALRGMPIELLVCGGTQVSSLEPLRGMPLKMLFCDRMPIDSLEPVSAAPLTSLYCDDDRIDSLEPLRHMKLERLTCRNNRVTSLAPLAGMALAALDVSGNPLTSLEPMVASPPASFAFACDSLPDAELQRARDIWSKAPAHRRHALNAAVLLALRHHDIAALHALASPFAGRRYLLLDVPLTWDRARSLCAGIGGRMAAITSREQNNFLATLLGGETPFIGLRRDQGKTTWDGPEPVTFTAWADASARDQDGIFVLNKDRWARNDAKGVAPVIVQWDGQP